MYTLVLLVIAHGMSGGVSVAATQFPTVSQGACERMAKLLMADSGREVQVKAYCVR